MEVKIVEPILIDAQVALQMRTRADELGMSMQEFAERAIKLAISIGKMAKDVPLDFDPDDYPLCGSCEGRHGE